MVGDPTEPRVDATVELAATQSTTLAAASDRRTASGLLPEGFWLTDQLQIGRLLGRGGFGDVYEAVTGDGSGPTLALKVLRQPTARALHAFKQEFRGLAELVHQNIVAMHELSTAGPVIHFTMELIHGSDFLSHVRPEGVLDVRRLRAALRGLLAGLCALHVSGRCHGDLKPSNVLVESGTGRVVLVDFGLAAALEDHADSENRVFRGTPAYASPEQLRGAPGSAASDWYAVGAMLHEALTGRLPGPDQYTTPAVAPLLADDSALAELCELLLRVEPELRAGAAELTRVLGAAPSTAAPLPPRTEGPWVGRVRELEELSAAFDEVSRGGDRCVLVSGPSGIGKTALVRRFTAALVQDRAPLVLYGRCYAQEHIPFRALDGIVDALCTLLMSPTPWPPATREIEGLAQAALLFPVLLRVPEIREASRRATGSASDSDARVRELGARGLCSLFAMLGRSEPAVLVVDDIQWDDDDSAWLLQALLDNAPPHGLLVILCVRDNERERSAILRVLERSTARLSRILCVVLGDLSGPEALSLAEQHASHPSAAGLIPLLDAARGHPHYVIELARMTRTGVATLPPPRSLAQALLLRCAPLAAADLLLLRTVCVAGHRLSLRVALAASGASALAVRRLAVARFITATVGDTGALVEPYHDQLREAVLSSLTPELVRSLRARLADTMLELGEERLDLIAIHLAAAGQAQRAARFAALAAASPQQALAVHSLPDLLELALDHGDVTTRPELLGRLAAAYARNGRAGEAARTYREAADHASSPDARFRLRCAAMAQAFQGGDLQLGHTLLWELEAARGPRVGLGLRSGLASAVAVLGLLAGRYPELATRPAEGPEAEAQGRSLTLSWSAMTGLLYGHHARAWHYAIVALGLSAQRGEARYYAPLLAAVSTMRALAAGVRQPATEQLLSYTALLAADSGDPTALTLVAMVRVVYFLATRQLDAAEACLEAALHPPSSDGGVAHYARSSAWLTSAPVFFWSGSIRRTCELSEALMLAARESRDLHLALGLQALSAYRLLAADRPEAAVTEWLEVARADPQHSALRDAHWGVLIGIYAGELSVARRALAISAHRLRRGSAVLPAARLLHLWARGLLLLAEWEQHGERAGTRRKLGLLIAAVAAHRDPGQRPFLLHLRAAEARMRGERARWLSLLRAAREAFAALGMRGFAASATLLLQLHHENDASSDEGTRAERYFGAEAIHRPERWARALLPGIGP